MRGRLQNVLPKLVLAPSFAAVLLFVYGFILWTIVSLLHQFEGLRQPNIVGWLNYQEALGLDVRDRSAVELVHRDRQHGRCSAASMSSSASRSA